MRILSFYSMFRVERLVQYPPQGAGVSTSDWFSLMSTILERGSSFLRTKHPWAMCFGWMSPALRAASSWKPSKHNGDKLITTTPNAALFLGLHPK
jgi:hypothetical protein